VHEWLEVTGMSMDPCKEMNVKLTDLMNRVQFPVSKQIENDQLKISRQLDMINVLTLTSRIYRVLFMGRLDIFLYVFVTVEVKCICVEWWWKFTSVSPSSV